jgi:hypothetical protein
MPLMEAFLTGFGILVGLVPWVLIFTATKNRKCWLWWHRTQWKGTLALTVTTLLSKALGFTLVFFIMKDIGQAGSGGFSMAIFYIDFPETLPFLFIFGNVPSTNGIELLAAVVLLDLVLVYLYFSAVLSCKSNFAKHAYEIER